MLKKMWKWFKANIRIIGLIGIGGWAVGRRVMALGLGQDPKPPGTNNSRSESARRYDAVAKGIVERVEKSIDSAGASAERLEEVLRGGVEDLERRDRDIKSVVADIDRDAQLADSRQGSDGSGFGSEDRGKPSVLPAAFGGSE